MGGKERNRIEEYKKVKKQVRTQGMHWNGVSSYFIIVTSMR